MTPSPNPAHEKSAYNWHILSSITLDGLESPDRYCEVLAAACCDGIGVIARWTRNPDRNWAVEAMDTESIDGMAPVLIFGDDEVVPPEPPVETICAPAPDPAPDKSAPPVRYMPYIEEDGRFIIDAGIKRSDEGDYVKFSDYAKLEADLAQARANEKALREALEKIPSAVPAMHEGGLIIEHYSGDGDYMGCESVDPLSVIQHLVSIAEQALASTQEDAP